MPINFNGDWDLEPANNNGATADEIIALVATAAQLGRGDWGLLHALSMNSAEVTVIKGIHGDYGTTDMHLTADYLGARWHIDLAQTAQGGRAGYRVRTVSQTRR